MPRENTPLVDALRARRRRAQRTYSRMRRSSSDDLTNIVGADVLVMSIGGTTRTYDVRAELSIVTSDADKTLASHAERMAVWGNLAETVKHEIAVLEIELEDILHNRYLAYRAAQRDADKRHNRNGTRSERWTDREITAVIETESEIIDARKALAEKRRCLGYCQSMVRAFSQRGSMIMKWGKMPQHADENLEY